VVLRFLGLKAELGRDLSAVLADGRRACGRFVDFPVDADGAPQVLERRADGAQDFLLHIKVANLWANRLIGDQKLPQKDRATWNSGQLFKAGDSLLPSGLLGLFALRAATRVEIAPCP
jgi:hypothetical protein